MKITRELDYNFDFNNDDEIKEFMAWCIENKNIMSSFRISYYVNTNVSTGSVEFKDEKGAMAFKLRWL